MLKMIKERGVGVVFVAILALLAQWIHILPFWPFTVGQGLHPVEPILIAILLGMLVTVILQLFSNGIANAVTGQQMGVATIQAIPNLIKPGAQYVVKKMLPFAIVLMGANLSLPMVLKVSGQALIVNIISVIIALTLTILISKWLKIDRALMILIAVGTAICGGSAIVVAAPVILAKETETAIAVSVITLFGLIAIFAFPFLGHLLHLDQTHFGIWAGASIQAIPQVIAAGVAYGDHAGDVATIVKLVRVLLLAPIILYLSFLQHKRDQKENPGKMKKASLTAFIPPFILGFLGMVVLSSLGVFQNIQWGNIEIHTHQIISTVSLFLITMAMSGIGLSTDIGHFLKSGLKPLIASFIAAVILSAVSLVLICFLV